MSPENAGLAADLAAISLDRPQVKRLKIATLRYGHRLGAGDGRYYAVTAQGSKENTGEKVKVLSAECRVLSPESLSAESFKSDQPPSDHIFSLFTVLPISLDAPPLCR